MTPGRSRHTMLPVLRCCACARAVTCPRPSRRSPQPFDGCPFPSYSTANWSRGRRTGSRSGGSRSGCIAGALPLSKPRLPSRPTTSCSSCSTSRARTSRTPIHREAAALETLFQGEGLAAPWSCARQQMMPKWPEGVWPDPWPAWKVAMIVRAVTDAPHHPRTLLLGRHDSDGRLEHAGRTSALPAVQTQIVGSPLRPVADRPSAGGSFSAGWGSRKKLQVPLAVTETVVEISTDVSPGCPRPCAPPCALCASACGHGRRRRAAPPSCEGERHEEEKKGGSLMPSSVMPRHSAGNDRQALLI